MLYLRPPGYHGYLELMIYHSPFILRKHGTRSNGVFEKTDSAKIGVISGIPPTPCRTEGLDYPFYK